MGDRAQYVLYSVQVGGVRCSVQVGAAGPKSAAPAGYSHSRTSVGCHMGLLATGILFMSQVGGAIGGNVYVIKVRLSDLMGHLVNSVAGVGSAAKQQISTSLAPAHATLHSVEASAQRVARDQSALVTTASGVSGAVVVGASGGAAGLVTGGALGAACGVPAALFTFGLSIPVCAVIGCCLGFCAGAVTGGTVGLVGG